MNRLGLGETELPHLHWYPSKSKEKEKSLCSYPACFYCCYKLISIALGKGYDYFVSGLGTRSLPATVSSVPCKTHSSKLNNLWQKLIHKTENKGFGKKSCKERGTIWQFFYASKMGSKWHNKNYPSSSFYHLSASFSPSSNLEGKSRPDGLQKHRAVLPRVELRNSL